MGNQAIQPRAMGDQKNTSRTETQILLHDGAELEPPDKPPPKRKLVSSGAAYRYQEWRAGARPLAVM